MDGEAWWAAVHGVAQSRIQLKRLSSSLAAKSLQMSPSAAMKLKDAYSSGEKL